MTDVVTAVGAAHALNLDIEVDGERFAYRRVGNPSATVPPLVLLQHFRGNLDYWDPALLDVLAADREVITVDLRGVGGSTGTTPDNVTDMARDALKFIDALGIATVDLLGFSLGGHIAQEIALVRPRLPRRLVLAGTAPQGAPDLHRWSRTSTHTPAPTRSPPRDSSRCSSPAPTRASNEAGSTWPAPMPATPTVTLKPVWPAVMRSTRP